jgi:hypothetical protein
LRFAAFDEILGDLTSMAVKAFNEQPQSMRLKNRSRIPAGFLLALSITAAPLQAVAAQITHAFLATGADTYLRSGDGQTLWRYPHGTRDGWVLANGNILLAVSKGDDYPGGAVVELTRDGKTVFEFKGSQSEVNTAQALPNGNIMLTEAGVYGKFVR